MPGAGYGVALPAASYDTEMTDADDRFRGYGAPMGRPGQMPSRPPVGAKPPAGGGTWTLRPAKSPDNTYTFGNL